MVGDEGFTTSATGLRYMRTPMNYISDGQRSSAIKSQKIKLFVSCDHSDIIADILELGFNTTSTHHANICTGASTACITTVIIYQPQIAQQCFCNNIRLLSFVKSNPSQSWVIFIVILLS